MRGFRILARDECAYGLEILYRRCRPVYLHSGGLRSRVVPQLASHFFTSSLLTNCASSRSASSIAALISAICHSLSSIYARIASAARKDLVRAVALASFSSRALILRSTRIVITSDIHVLSRIHAHTTTVPIIVTHRDRSSSPPPRNDRTPRP